MIFKNYWSFGLHKISIFWIQKTIMLKILKLFWKFDKVDQNINQNDYSSKSENKIKFEILCALRSSKITFKIGVKYGLILPNSTVSFKFSEFLNLHFQKQDNSPVSRELFKVFSPLTFT